MEFRNLTFIILVQFDTIERFENFQIVLKFLKNYFNFEILLVNCISSHYNDMFALNNDNCNSVFDNDSILHRTFYLNKLILNSKSSYVGVWDSDIIIPICQIKAGFEFLENGDADIVYSYSHFFDTTPIIRKLFLEDNNIEILDRNQRKMKELYTPNPLGGAFIVNREAYIKAGMENEDFYGWGMEDGERFYRWQRLGYRVKRVPGPLFHLSHPRGINSKFHNQDQSLWKRKETLKAKRLAESVGFDEGSWSGE